MKSMNIWTAGVFLFVVILSLVVGFRACGKLKKPIASSSVGVTA